MSFCLSNTTAVTLAKALRKQQELESFSKTAPLHYPVVSQRTVLPARNQPKDPESRDRTCFKNISPPQLEEVQMLGDASVEPETATDFLDGGAETKPLIGKLLIILLFGSNIFQILNQYEQDDCIITSLTSFIIQTSH